MYEFDTDCLGFLDLPDFERFTHDFKTSLSYASGSERNFDASVSADDFSMGGYGDSSEFSFVIRIGSAKNMKSISK
jgi:hypothetical protein